MDRRLSCDDVVGDSEEIGSRPCRRSNPLSPFISENNQQQSLPTDELKSDVGEEPPSPFPVPPLPGRRRHSSQLMFSTQSFAAKMNQLLALLAILASAIFRIAEACSSRSTPKPRSPSQNTRPNITFPTFECPKEYQSYYCLNGARCFTVKIENNVLYNCECADGFTGSRCEFKDLEGSYLPNREKVNIETASIAGGVTVAVLLFVILFIGLYVYVRRRKKSPKQEEVHQPFDVSKPTQSLPLKNISSRSNDSDLEAGDSYDRACLQSSPPRQPASVTPGRSRIGIP